MNAPTDVRSAAPIVALKDISRWFVAPDGDDQSALEHITLDVFPGEFVSLLGPSGSGKSTLLRIVGDLLAPSEGSVLVRGKSPRQARLDRDYGIVFQKPVLYDWRTALENVKLPLEIDKQDAKTRDRRARELLALVGLSDFADHRPWQLSGGMQQRVSIARALASEPALLLMDEPFGALDEMTREHLNNELLTIWARTGTSILFVTHSIAEAVFLSTRVVVLTPRPGRIAAIVPIDLPQPRTAEMRDTPEFFTLVTQVRAVLRSE